MTALPAPFPATLLVHLSADETVELAEVERALDVARRNLQRLKDKRLVLRDRARMRLRTNARVPQ